MRTDKESTQDIEEGNDVGPDTVPLCTANSALPRAVEVIFDESINTQSSTTYHHRNGSSNSDSLTRASQRPLQMDHQQGPPDAPSSSPQEDPPSPPNSDADFSRRSPVPTTSGLASTPLPEEHSPDSDPATSKKFFRKITIVHWAFAILILLVLVLVTMLVWALSREIPSSSSISSTVTEDETPIVSPGSEPSLKTIDIVRKRGALRCGVVHEHDGFSIINSDTRIREGFEADLCRAIAAAALGSGGKVEFVSVTPTDRFIALYNGTVDVLASHTTETMDRDVYEATAQAGFTFSTPYLYDGLTFGGQPEFVDCADRLGANCTGLRICVLSLTTHAETVKELIKSATINEYPSLDATYNGFATNDPNRHCNVIAGGQFEVAETVVRKTAASFTREYKVGVGIFSHEPLALVTRDGEPFWSDMVQWVLQALLTAEEKGITQKTSARLESTPHFGANFSNLFQNAVAEVGNFGELYERHLEKGVLPRAKINEINNGSSGLIFSFPFGSASKIKGPGPVDGGTLKRIKDRGHLRCGITRFPGFAQFDTLTEVWSGFDIEFCRAIAAAIFDGVSRNVVYTIIPATERFTALANGDLDVLSRITTWTLERDVAEPQSDGKGFDFSQITFYDGIAVGGISKFAKCADNVDTSTSCDGLRVCVNSGTTTIDIARHLFGEEKLVKKQNSEEVIQGLANGECNVVIGAVLEIVENSVAELGFEGDYKLGSNRFSKDPLAVVTRQDDPQFSAFVKWIVSAIFYAEEQGIDQSTAEDMPLVSVFGPLYSRMLKDAIQATGNYGDIYSRHLKHLVPRGGLNALSVNPYGPRHYPLPGI